MNIAVVDSAAHLIAFEVPPTPTPAPHPLHIPLPPPLPFKPNTALHNTTQHIHKRARTHPNPPRRSAAVRVCGRAHTPTLPAPQWLLLAS